MQYFYNEQDYQNYLYRRRLKKTANGLGALLLTFFGLEIVIVLAIQLPMMLSGVWDNSDMLLLLENGMISMLIFFVASLIYCLIKRSNLGELFPFKPIGARMTVMLSVAGLGLSLASNYVVELVNNVFGLFGVTNSGGSFDVSTSPLVYFLTVAILPALAEEFAFRGVIMGMLKPYSSALALVVSSAAFGLMHGNFVQLPFTFCCGLVFGYIDLKTGSLLPSIIIHFLNNGLSVASDIAVTNNILSTEMVNAVYGLIILVTGVLAIVFIRRIAREQPDFFRFDDSDQPIPFKSKMTAVASSPTLISYTVVMILYCIFELFAPEIS